MALTILHTADFHGNLTGEKASTIASYNSSDALYFDCGDCIKTGNLGIPFGDDPAWSYLEKAGCDAGTIGNRESHIIKKAFHSKIAGAKHPLICANLFDRSGKTPLQETLVLKCAGHRVGLIGVMVPMVTSSMATKAASHFVWEDPIEIAQKWADKLRPEVDCLVALTHIGIDKDKELANACPLFDLILGGHSHTTLPEGLRVGQTLICHTGSHGRYLGFTHWNGRGDSETCLVAMVP